MTPSFLHAMIRILEIHKTKTLLLQCIPTPPENVLLFILRIKYLDSLCFKVLYVYIFCFASPLEHHFSHYQKINLEVENLSVLQLKPKEVASTEPAAAWHVFFLIIDNRSWYDASRVFVRNVHKFKRTILQQRCKVGGVNFCHRQCVLLLEHFYSLDQH